MEKRSSGMETETQVRPEASEEESFKKLFEESLRKQPAAPERGELVRGVVVARSGNEVILDVGAKAEGSVPIEEFETLGLPVPETGDEVEALVRAGGPTGTSLSVLAARKREIWDRIEAAREEGRTLRGRIVESVKGGFRVDMGGLTAFMPRSEADTDIRTSPEELIGAECEVAILKAARRPENVVVSRRQPLAEVESERRELFFAETNVGDRVSGVVKRLTDFGAFVEVERGVDALLHISDISWRRLDHPSEMLSPGQQINAEVIKLNSETGKVSISMRALQPDPWETVSRTYEPGMRLTGTVRRLLEFGAVVELEPGIEGMIHRSEMSWTRANVKPVEILAEGDVVDVAVLSVEPESRRIRLSLKEVSENPWQVWLENHPVGSKVTGKVKNKTDFGFFVALEEGLDGLVHLGNISWKRPGEEAMADYAKGQEVECVVLGVDVPRQRISLGIKQLSDDPFEVFLSGVRRGSAVRGEVVEAKGGGFRVALADGVVANLAMREVPREHGEIRVGSEIEAKVVDVNRKRRRVELSIRQLQRDEEREAVRSYARSMEQEETPSPLALELQRKLLGEKGEGGS